MVKKSTLKFLLTSYSINKIIRAIAFLIYDSIKKSNLVLNESRIIKVNNYKIKTIQKDTGISSELLIYGTHEPLTTKITSNEVKDGMICFDIGSNIGYYALLESNLIKEEGKVYAFEPSPINFSALSKNVELNKCKNIMLFNYAMGEKNEELDFIISKESNWSKISTDKDIKMDGTKIIRVPVKSIDSFCIENNILKIDFLRMDVEGYERRVIEGAKGILKKFHPKLMIEIHKMYLGKSETSQLLRTLHDLGYQIKFYLPRIYDTPIIGNESDIKRYTVMELIEKLERNKLPDVFQLVLEFKNN